MASKLKLMNENGKVLSIESGSIESDKVLEPGDFKYIRDTISSLGSISNPLDGDVCFVKGYHTNDDNAGGTFIYRANKAKSEHNGGTIIDPSKEFPNDWNDNIQQESWFTADNEGNGVWERVYTGSVNVKWFGAKGDEVTDDTYAIQKCIESSYNIIFSKSNYLLKGVVNLPFNINIDFNDSTLLLDGGYFKGYRESVDVTEEFKNSFTTLNENSVDMPYDNKNGYFIIHTNEDFISYNEEIHKRTFYVQIINGHLNVPLDFTLNSSDITNVEYFDTDTNIFFTNCNIMFKNKTYYIFNITGFNNVKLKNIYINNAPISYGNSLIQIYKCFNINIKHLYCDINYEATDSIYVLSIYRTNNIYIEDFATNSKMWHYIASGDSSNFYIKNSYINGIDSHMPIRGYLKVEDTTLGNFGITLSLIGNLYLNNITQFISNDDIIYSGLCNGRLDVNSIFYGEAFIDGVTVISSKEDYTFSMIRPYSSANVNNGLLITAETQRYGKQWNIANLYSKTKNNIYIYNDISDEPKTIVPYVISINNCLNNKDTIIVSDNVINVDDSTLYINIDNIKTNDVINLSEIQTDLKISNSIFNTLRLNKLNTATISNTKLSLNITRSTKLFLNNCNLSALYIYDIDSVYGKITNSILNNLDFSYSKNITYTSNMLIDSDGNVTNKYQINDSKGSTNIKAIGDNTTLAYQIDDSDLHTIPFKKLNGYRNVIKTPKGYAEFTVDNNTITIHHSETDEDFGYLFVVI